MIFERLRDTPISQVARHHGLSERQVRRIMSAHRESPGPVDEEVVENVMRNLRELGDLVEKRFEAAREEGEGLPDLLTALERQWRLLRDTGLLGPDVWEERAEAVRRGEAQEAAASINRRLRARLEAEGVDASVINEATDIAIEVLLDEDPAERADIVNASTFPLRGLSRWIIARLEGVRQTASRTNSGMQYEHLRNRRSQVRILSGA